jgi:hypothetical protein
MGACPRSQKTDAKACHLRAAPRASIAIVRWDRRVSCNGDSATVEAVSCEGANWVTLGLTVRIGD